MIELIVHWKHEYIKAQTESQVFPVCSASNRTNSIIRSIEIYYTYYL